MTKDEALKMALEALEKYEDEWLESGKRVYVDDEITAIKEALAQPEQILPSVYSNTHQPEQEPVRIMREMLEVQGQHGNWNYDSYMHGLYNGMEYMVALAEKREPKFRDAPDDWLAKYEVKRDNFNSTEPLTEATPPQRTWVGLTRKQVHDLYDSDYAVFHQRIEAKLKQQNGYAEEST